MSPLVTMANLDQELTRVERARELVVDLETSGLRPLHGDRLLGVAVAADEHDPVYFSFRHAADNLPERYMHMLLGLICSLETDTPTRVIGGHNLIRFDLPMIAVESPMYCDALLMSDRVPKWDTIIDALLANENEPHFSLDALGQKYLGASAAKRGEKDALLAALRERNPKIRAKRLLMGRMETLTGSWTAPYACADVSDTRALRRKYVPHHAAWGLTQLSEEMYRYARLLARIERRGLLVDQEECRRRIDRCLEEQRAVGGRIREKLEDPDFNPDSPAQVCRVLGTPDAQKDTLKACGHPLAKEIILYKRLGKVCSTYYEAMLERAVDGVIHPRMLLTATPQGKGGTKSSRLSCADPNFQNLPKRSPDWFMQVRDVVLARPGHKLITLDYERAEMWLAGHYSQDRSLREAYEANRDLYEELAVQTETDRQGAKIDWLAIQYGARGRKLSEMHGWPFKSVEELEREFNIPVEQWANPQWRAYMEQKGPSVVNAFFELCPGIKAAMKSLEETGIKQGFIRLWTGRVVHVDGWHTPPWVLWNRLIQGGVGEEVRLSMQRLEPVLDQLGAEMLLQVHDEIVIEAPDAAVPAVVECASRVMTDFNNFRLRPRVEPKIGRTYGSVQPFVKEAA